MDGFLSYNQITMALEDMEKITLLTIWGTFCYKVMPFGLKNAKATYQRAMVMLFHDMMHKKIKVYVDDIIAKSQGDDDHVVNFKEAIRTIKKIPIKAQPDEIYFWGYIRKIIRFCDQQKRN